MSVFCLGAVLCCGVVSCRTAEQRGSIAAFSGSSVEQGRPAAGLARYRIDYYEPVEGKGALSGGGASGGGIQESNAPFIIADYGPRDILPKEIKKPSIYVVFSQPVTALAKLGDPMRDGAGLFTIDPPLAGVYRWYGSKLLSFEPDAESMPQRRYTITVSDRVTSLGGKKLQGERSFSFETDRLSVLEWQLGADDRYIRTDNVDPEDAQHIRLIFSYPVNLDEIARWIEIRGNSRTWPFTLERLPRIDERRFQAEQGVLVTITEKLPLDTDMVMELKAGARSEPGWLGSREAKTWTYHTLLPFRFHNVAVRSYSPLQYDLIPITLEFSQRVEPEGAEQYFSLTGSPR